LRKKVGILDACRIDAAAEAKLVASHNAAQRICNFTHMLTDNLIIVSVCADIELTAHTDRGHAVQFGWGRHAEFSRRQWLHWLLVNKVPAVPDSKFVHQRRRNGVRM